MKHATQQMQAYITVEVDEDRLLRGRAAIREPPIAKLDRPLNINGPITNIWNSTSTGGVRPRMKCYGQE